jgi:hypothetical protein
MANAPRPRANPERRPGAATSRRHWLQVLLPTALGLSGWACEAKSFRCDDLTGLAPGDIEARKNLDYKELAEKPELACRNCAQYVPPSGSNCASCRVMRGPVHPEGWCKVFAPSS